MSSLFAWLMDAGPVDVLTRLRRRWWQPHDEWASGAGWHSWHHHTQVTRNAERGITWSHSHLQGSRSCHDVITNVCVQIGVGWLLLRISQQAKNQGITRSAIYNCFTFIDVVTKYKVLKSFSYLTVNICFQILMARSGFLGTFLRYFIRSDLSLIQSRSDNIQEWGSNLEYFGWI